eukprot:scaffold51406_cov50-Phaeocystis_antarctica.AAC.3
MKECTGRSSEGHLPLTIHHLQLTTHYSLLTTATHDSRLTAHLDEVKQRAALREGDHLRLQPPRLLLSVLGDRPLEGALHLGHEGLVRVGLRVGVRLRLRVSVRLRVGVGVEGRWARLELRPQCKEEVGRLRHQYELLLQ